MLAGVSALFVTFSLAGHVQAGLGAALLARFRKTADRTSRALEENTRSWPAVSLLKPLHGQEPLLEEALETCFQLDYPDYELVFGVHCANDPALDVVRKLQKRYPAQNVSVIINSSEHGLNRKVSNLINLYPACQHDILVIADSDIHVERLYLKQIVSTLEQPDTALVTTLYAGLPADRRIVRVFGAFSINANFLSGVMMSRLMGRQDCLGATMALTRQTVGQIGGFAALVNHVADDAILGHLVRRQGGTIRLAPTLCLTTVTEERFRDLVAHELRWGRTVRSIEPVGYGFSALQLPLFWASLAVLCTPGSGLIWSLFGIGWLFRSLTSWQIGRLTKCPLPGILPLLVVRDWLSSAIMVGSARGSRVAWRGRTVHITHKNTVLTSPAGDNVHSAARPSRMNRSARS